MDLGKGQTVFEELTAWHERNPLLDAFCEGLDNPDPRSTARFEGFAFETDVHSGNGRDASPTH